MEGANNFKEEGNKYFKEGNISEALSCYTKALQLNPSGGAETATYLKNRAACFLKQEKHMDVVTDCTAGMYVCDYGE